MNALFAAVDQAIEPVLGWHPVLSEYEIKAVSAGEDAQGQVLVRCRRSTDEGPGALVVTGHGLSTNIIEASVEAYLSAINKLHGAEIGSVRAGVRGPAASENAAMSGEATYRIVAIPGDGVGPDVVGAGRRVIDAIGPAFGFRVEWDERIVGGAAIDAYRRPDPRRGRRGVPRGRRRAPGRVRRPQVGQRRPEDPARAGAVPAPQGAGAVRQRPPGHGAARARAFARRSAPELLEAVDLLILRELTGGLYFGKPSEERIGADGSREAVDTMFYTEAEIRRIVRLGFELAQARPRKKLTSVDKQNVLATSRLWRKIVEEERRTSPTSRSTTSWSTRPRCCSSSGRARST